MKMFLLVLLFLTTPIYAQFDLNSEDASLSIQQPKEKKEEKKGFFSFLKLPFLKGLDEDVKVKKTKEGVSFLEDLNELAENDDEQAIGALGYIYLYGDEDLGVERNPEKAFEYYSKGAKLNNVLSLNNLANLYYSGIGVERDRKAAAENFKKSVELGSVDAAVNLAFMFLTGDGVLLSKDNAAFLFNYAAKEGNVISQYMLGLCYYYGVNYPRDYNVASSYVEKAAKAGFDEAQFFLAKMYLKGHGVPQNYGIGVSLLNKAIKQDNLNAMYGLADILATGYRYPKDLFKAHILYNLSSVKGKKDAANKRAVIEKLLKIEEILEAQAQANRFVFAPTEITTYVRSTFGRNLERLIED